MKPHPTRDPNSDLNKELKTLLKNIKVLYSPDSLRIHMKGSEGCSSFKLDEDNDDNTLDNFVATCMTKRGIITHENFKYIKTTDQGININNVLTIHIGAHMSDVYQIVQGIIEPEE